MRMRSWRRKAQMVLEEIVQFLKQVPPFQFLDAAALNRVALKVAVEYYPKGTLIHEQDGPPSQHLMVIKKGGVKVFLRTADEEEMVLDYRSEGDAFGFLSLVSGDRSRTNIVTIEDSIVYQVDRAVILKLLESSPAFTEYYVKSFLNKFVDKTFAEMHSTSLLCGGGDKLLFTTPVGESRQQGRRDRPRQRQHPRGGAAHDGEEHQLPDRGGRVRRAERHPDGPGPAREGRGRGPGDLRPDQRDHVRRDHADRGQEPLL